MSPSPSPFVRPGWLPAAEPGARILVLGASGGLGRALVDMLLEGSDCTIGAHGDTRLYDAGGDSRVVPLKATLKDESDCADVVERFGAAAGGIDALVMLAGGLTATDHWDNLSEAEWRADVDLNLNIPFFAARAAMRPMKAQGTGGRIVLNGTDSALHGGSPQSFPYTPSPSAVPRP